jgi:PKD repeat protein
MCSILFILLAGLGAPKAGAATLADNGNGTVTDSKTGLIWQQGEPGVKTWGDALTYCEGLSLAGQNDWRLPNVKELESLTDDARYNPTIDRAYFPNANASVYWSSTTSTVAGTHGAFIVFFDYGYVSINSKHYSYYIRCVRGGQSAPPVFIGASLPGATTLPGVIKFSGVASDDIGIKSIAMNVSGPAGNNISAFVDTDFIAGQKTKNLSNYFFDSNRAAYSGVAGTYTVKLTVTDTNNQSTTTAPFTVVVGNAVNSNPTFSNAAINSAVKMPQRISFSGTANDDTGIKSVQMIVNGPKGLSTVFTDSKFTAGTKSKDLAAYYFDSTNSSYAGVAGAYSVKLKVTDVSGNVTESSAFPVTVSANPIYIGVTPVTDEQGNTFTYLGGNFTPGCNVAWHVLKPDNKEFPVAPLTGKITTAGVFAHSYQSSCGTEPGIYTLWAEDTCSGFISNKVKQTVTQSQTCIKPPIITIANIGDQTQYKEFEIMVTVDDGYGKNVTGKVSLQTASKSKMKPESIDVGDGQPKKITLSTAYNDEVIYATYNGVIGKSNSFKVSWDPQSTPIVPVTYNLIGKVIDKVGGVAAVNASVVVKNVATGVSTTLVTSSVVGEAGKFKGYFADGKYEVIANNGTRYSKTESVEITNVPLPIKLEINPTLPPVILIPGVFGSTLKAIGDASCIPQLSKNMDVLKIYDPKGMIFGDSIACYPTGFNALHEQLKVNFNVYQMPWDWRLDSATVVKEFLIKMIDEIKNTGYDKVDIVAHSQGGLIVRDYIQGTSYNNDIDKFIMVGTPNQGSANAHWFYSTGDPMALDRAVIETKNPGVLDVLKCALGLNKCMLSGALGMVEEYLTVPYFYIFNDLYEKMMTGKKFEDMKTPEERVTWLNKNAPGPRKLLPSYTNVFKDTNNPAWGMSAYLNPWLSNLNKDENNLSRMTKMYYPATKEYSTDSSKVKTALLLSNNQNTFCTVNVDSTTPSLNPYPVKIGDTVMQKKDCLGDGTVSSEKAQEKLAPYAYINAEPKGTHSTLIGGFKDEIEALLCLGRPCSLTTTPLRAMASPSLVTASATTTPTHLSVSLVGSAQPALTNSTGKISGINAQTGEYAEEIPETSDIILNSVSSLVELTNPLDGIYTVTLKSQDEGEVNHLYFSWDDGTNSQSKKVRLLTHAGLTSFNITFNSAATDKIVISNPASPPENISATNEAGMAKLNWNAPADATISGYNIYAKQEDQPLFTLIGTSTDSFYSSTILWDTDGSVDNWDFIVVSKTADGKESFLATVVDNRTSLIATFGADKTSCTTLPCTVTFSDGTSGAVSSWNWDFGDGVTSTEQNPSHIYTTNGNFIVTLNVTGPDGSSTSSITVISPINGICGTSNGGIFSAAPTTNLCSPDAAASLTTTATGWSWTCDGSNGGTTATCTANQTPATNIQTTLKTGWNLMGWTTTQGYYQGTTAPLSTEQASSATMSSNTMSTVFTSLGLPSTESFVIVGPDGVVYMPGSPFNTLKKALPGKGYWIYTPSDKTITVPGSALSPTDQLPLSSGWTQIAYWGTDGVAPATGFVCINGLYDILVDETGKVYMSGSPFNTLKTLQKNKGYFIHTTAPAMLVYQCP